MIATEEHYMSKAVNTTPHEGDDETYQSGDSSQTGRLAALSWKQQKSVIWGELRLAAMDKQGVIFR